MAHRSPQRITSVSPPLARPRRPLRRSPTPRRRKPISNSSNSRPVLVPLHPNLRRLPSRVYLEQKDSEMREIASHQVGSKRKRVIGTNENAHTGGRPTRGSGTLKRQRITSDARLNYTSDDGASSSMDVDTQSLLSSAATTEAEDDDDKEDDSTDDFLISSAEPHQLQRLRKDELVRLYTLAGLSDDTDNLTKSEIIDSIVAARDDIASLPPSSPPGRGDGNSTEYSSDDGAIESFRLGLRRRVTTNDILKSRRPTKNRSLSMGNLLEHRTLKHSSGEASGSSAPRRRTSSRSSSSTSANDTSFPPSTAHRLRSRKISAPTKPVSPDSPRTPTSTMAVHKSSKTKGKQVEFSKIVEVKTATPVKVSGFTVGEESDLTELEESELEAIPQPSPRRLRSKDREAKARVVEEEEQSLDMRRITPMRRAKRMVRNLREEEENDGDMEDEADEDEVDELVSTASVTPPPPPVIRTPLKRRLRPRPRPDAVAEGSEAEEEELGDAEDEEDGEEDGEAEEDQIGNDAEGEDEDDGEAEEDEDENDAEGEDEDDDETTIAVEPRKLRNGKIVGEEDAEMEDTPDSEEMREDDSNEETASIDVDEVEEEAEEEPMEEEPMEEESMEEESMEEDVDLTVATAKTLIRLRRDDLIRLCETRDLEPVGTKPQLAEALLQWRDRQTNDGSSPSSTGTVRPPSTVVKRRRGKRSSQGTPPVLDRSNRFHMDEPLTPPVSHRKETEPELELDLGTLGLEDREIPPDKLQKLEKIGSGGFKDVYVGKFRGRKIAISEFRGQLSAMDIKELKLLGGFDHPNIVRFLGVSIPENPRDTPVMIVSELCANGDLFDYVRNVNAPSLHKVLSIMLDIARGLEYLHLRKPSVIHRDCKSSNILITYKGTAKIADFGLAKVKQSTRSMVRSLVGTVNWQAPELWHAHPKYNHKVDVFSCAMVYWEMLQWHLPNKKFPWEGMNEHAIYEIVGTKRQRPSIVGLRKQWCPEVVDLVERMWAQEHQERPTMTRVVEELEDMLRRW